MILNFGVFDEIWKIIEFCVLFLIVLVIDDYLSPVTIIIIIEQWHEIVLLYFKISVMHMISLSYKFFLTYLSYLYIILLNSTTFTLILGSPHNLILPNFEPNNLFEKYRHLEILFKYNRMIIIFFVGNFHNG